MKYTELFKLLTSNIWMNIDNRDHYSFFWSEEDRSMNMRFENEKYHGKIESHQYVQLFLSKSEQEDCKILRFQSNLFTSEFIWEPASQEIQVKSKVFGNLHLHVISNTQNNID